MKSETTVYQVIGYNHDCKRTTSKHIAVPDFVPEWLVKKFCDSLNQSIEICTLIKCYTTNTKHLMNSAKYDEDDRELVNIWLKYVLWDEDCELKTFDEKTVLLRHKSGYYELTV